MEPFGGFAVEVKVGTAFKFTDGESVDIFKSEQGMHETFGSIDVRHSECTGRHFQNFCKVPRQVFFGEWVPFSYCDMRKSAVFSGKPAPYQEFQGQVAKTTDGLVVV